MLSNFYRKLKVTVVFLSELTTTGGSAGYHVYHIFMIIHIYIYDLNAYKSYFVDHKSKVDLFFEGVIKHTGKHIPLTFLENSAVLLY